MYDVAIIGSGPAGVSAAINLQIHNKNFIWFGNGNLSKKAGLAELINNYPGLPEVTGKQLVWTLSNHIDRMNIKITQEQVSGVYDMEGYFSLLANGNSYESRAVILCVGVEEIKSLKNEENFVGRGISYCATCDGFLYKGKKIAVLSTDKRFESEVEYLCSLAHTAIVMPIYKNAEIKAENVKTVTKLPIAVKGDEKLKGLVFNDEEIEVDGLFILKNALPPSALVHGLATQQGHISVDRKCKTNVSGVFAAGDCTGRPYQYAKAIGEGNVAAHSVLEYLSQIKN